MKVDRKYEIVGEMQDIQRILVDLVAYGEHHPLINKVTKLDKTIEDHVDFKIRERPLSWLPVNIHYYANVTYEGNQVIYKISGIPLTRARITYLLSQQSNKVIEVLFKLEIDSWMPGKVILRNKMLSAQDSLMKSMSESLK